MLNGSGEKRVIVLLNYGRVLCSGESLESSFFISDNGKLWRLTCFFLGRGIFIEVLLYLVTLLCNRLRKLTGTFFGPVSADPRGIPGRPWRGK